jgi:hypothetical protein
MLKKAQITSRDVATGYKLTFEKLFKKQATNLPKLLLSYAGCP